MSTEERKERIEHLHGWLMDLRTELGLSNWRIRLSYNPPWTENAIAEFIRRFGQLEGEIRFSDEFFRMSLEDQREIAIHELLHPHMRPTWEVWSGLENVIGQVAWQILSRQFELAEELMADTISRAIAYRFPLPPEWPPVEGEAEPGTLELPILMRFPDGDTLARTIIVDPASLESLTLAVTEIQAEKVTQTLSQE